MAKGRSLSMARRLRVHGFWGGGVYFFLSLVGLRIFGIYNPARRLTI
jgi:hypothetical protein